MSLSFVKKVKKTSFFRPLDLLVYGVLLALILLFFALSGITKDGAGKIQGLTISVKGEEIAYYSYQDDTFTQKSAFAGSIVCEKKSDGTHLKISFFDGGENELFVSSDHSLAKMKEANCSNTKDCTFLSISSPTDFILCAPHFLLVTPAFEGLEIPDILA